MAKKDYSSSNRRKFLIGAGSVAAGGSALFGTAATTTFNLNNRSVGANVVADSNGALKLTDEEEQGDIINEVDDKLAIDFAAGDGGGVNVGSVVEVGDFTSPDNDQAFTITNQTTDEVDVVIEFKADSDYSAESDGSKLEFRIEHNSTSKILKADNGLTPDSTESVEFLDGGGESLGDGETLDVAIRVDADNSDSSTSENLSGVLNITATQG